MYKRQLLITVPYEGGWKLTLDGEKQEILKADLGFMGVRVRAGSHTFSLDYHPPLLKEGCILSPVSYTHLDVYKRQAMIRGSG